MSILSIIFLITYTAFGSTSTNTWHKDYELPGKKKCFYNHGHKVCFSDSNRKNVFNKSELEQESSIVNGSKHALIYPVTVSDLVIPYDTLTKIFKSKKIALKIPLALKGLKSIDDIYNWVGLHKYPKSKDSKSPNYIYNIKKFDNERMGATVFYNNKNTRLLTFGCASCHLSNLFGTKVLGMTNRFPRANEFFKSGKSVISIAHPKLYKIITKATEVEVSIYTKARATTKFIGSKKPLVLGLDTSLAQVALSLSKRSDDEYASRIKTKERGNQLSVLPADSKPAVWWNLKYKTKWLSDGSIRSGNPIHTNFLWNEIGRGTDLKKLEKWMVNNEDIINDLTSYVFNTEAPKYNDFFPNTIDIAKAKRGQIIYRKNCMSCHGDYEKGWESSATKYDEQLKTTKTWYHTKTITVDVKTDEYRYKGMRYFYKDLNKLRISKSIGTVVTPQEGYVPPPLVGIWARWPYFHNNSVPTLYDVLTPDYLRPKEYYAFKAIDKVKDFDQVKNGYPKRRNKAKYKFNTRLRGLSNKGHSFMLLNKNKKPKFSHQQKLEIIEFLKTL